MLKNGYCYIAFVIFIIKGYSNLLYLSLERFKIEIKIIVKHLDPISIQISCHGDSIKTFLYFIFDKD